jgi:hypothetical protein
VSTARYARSSYIKQTHFVFKGLNLEFCVGLCFQRSLSVVNHFCTRNIEEKRRKLLKYALYILTRYLKYNMKHRRLILWRKNPTV